MFIFFFFDATATTEIYTLSHTTLFRSERSSCRRGHPWRRRTPARRSAAGPPSLLLHMAAEAEPHGGQHAVLRSEEHTSELQSLTNLVCRLLLEKKKKNTKTKMKYRNIN